MPDTVLYALNGLIQLILTTANKAGTYHHFRADGTEVQIKYSWNVVGLGGMAAQSLLLSTCLIFELTKTQSQPIPYRDI